MRVAAIKRLLEQKRARRRELQRERRLATSLYAEQAWDAWIRDCTREINHLLAQLPIVKPPVTRSASSPPSGRKARARPRTRA
jgi:hypothetical protein